MEYTQSNKDKKEGMAKKMYEMHGKKSPKKGGMKHRGHGEKYNENGKSVKMHGGEKARESGTRPHEGGGEKATQANKKASFSENVYSQHGKKA